MPEFGTPTFRATPKWMPRGLCSRRSMDHLKEHGAIFAGKWESISNTTGYARPQSAGKRGGEERRGRWGCAWSRRAVEGGSFSFLMLKMGNLCPMGTYVAVPQWGGLEQVELG